MNAGWNGQECERQIAAVTKAGRRPVAITFLDKAPTNVGKFEGTVPAGCSFWRLAAEGRRFYTVPESHFNCAVGAHTHNIAMSPEREKETEQTLKMMFDRGYAESVRYASPRLSESQQKGPTARRGPRRDVRWP